MYSTYKIQYLWCSCMILANVFCMWITSLVCRNNFHVAEVHSIPLVKSANDWGIIMDPSSSGGKGCQFLSTFLFRKKSWYISNEGYFEISYVFQHSQSLKLKQMNENCHSHYSFVLLLAQAFFKFTFHWLWPKSYFSLTPQKIHWLFTGLEKILTFSWPLATLACIREYDNQGLVSFTHHFETPTD